MALLSQTFRYSTTEPDLEGKNSCLACTLLMRISLGIAVLFLCVIAHAQTPAQAPGAPGQLTIDGAVQEALDKNLDIIAERFNLPVASARIITAKLRPNPVVSVGGDHLDLLGTGYNRVNGAGPPEYSVRTDFLFERGGKRASRIAVAENSRAVVELQFLDTIRNLIMDVQNAFTDVLLAKENLALAQENLRAFDDIVRVNQSRVRSGDLAEVELLRTELAQLQFENAARQGEMKLKTSLSRLQLLLGRGQIAAPPDLAGEIRRDAESVTQKQLEQTALEFRPDLRSVRQDQARSLAELRLQLAQGKVDYTVGSEYRRQDGLAGRGNSLGFFVSTNLPIFNRNQGEIERARQEQRQLEARLRALTASINTEVETAYLQYTTARTTLERLEKTMLGKARDVRQITEFSYRRGEATLVEFLDAQRAYNETIQTYNEARAEYARSLYLMDSVSGKAVNR